MSLIKKIKKHLAGSNGVVAVIVALLITGIIGMTALVVDMGSLYEDRRSLQGVADAAALAGVQELPESRANAEQAAMNSVAQNYQDDNYIVGIEIGSFMGVPDTEIKVTVSNPDSPLYFGRIYGSNSENVGATATAIMGSPNPIGEHVVPWGLTEGDYVYGEEVFLKYGAPPEHSPGNFGSLRIDGQGADDYREGIINGCDTPLFIGMPVQTLTGNKVGPTEQGVNGRVARLPDGVWTKPLSSLWDENYCLQIYDTQFIIIPIISEWPSGSGWVTILDFKLFVISEFVEAGGHSYVKGTFIKCAVFPTTGGVGGLDDTGLRTIRLIK